MLKSQPYSSRQGSDAHTMQNGVQTQGGRPACLLGFDELIEFSRTQVRARATQGALPTDRGAPHPQDISTPLESCSAPPTHAP